MADSKERMEGIVGAIDKAREELLGYDPPWVDPAYETVRMEVDRQLRQAQLAIGKLFEDAATAPTLPVGGE